MLLQRVDIDPHSPDENGETPLFRAAFEGHEGVLKVLLERVDVNSDMPALTSEAALLQARKHGHQAIVKLLSERKNSIPPSNGHRSPTPSSPEPPDLDQHPFKRVRRF